jgi:hypothetical protein
LANGSFLNVVLVMASPTINPEEEMKRFKFNEKYWLGTASCIGSANENGPNPDSAALVIPRVLDRTHMQDFPATDAHS